MNNNSIKRQGFGPLSLSRLAWELRYDPKKSHRHSRLINFDLKLIGRAVSKSVQEFRPSGKCFELGNNVIVIQMASNLRTGSVVAKGRSRNPEKCECGFLNCAVSRWTHPFSSAWVCMPSKATPRKRLEPQLWLERPLFGTLSLLPWCCCLISPRTNLKIIRTNKMKQNLTNSNKKRLLKFNTFVKQRKWLMQTQR